MCLLIGVATGALGQDAEPLRAITPIRGDLYQARDGDRVTAFLVTPAGIVLADPLTPATVRWLKTELAARFPDRPVRYVLYTGHRFERTRGASALTETAEIIAHERFGRERSAASESLPPAWAPFDRNGNARLERSEAIAIGADVEARDFDRDGEVTPPEAWSEVASPEATYSTMRALTLGGHRITLVHAGDGLGADECCCSSRTNASSSHRP